MNTADRILALKLVTDVGDIKKQSKGVQGQFRSMAASAKSWGRALTGSLVLGGLAEVSSMMRDAVGGFKDGEAAADALGLTWKNLGMRGSELADVIDDVSNKAVNLGFDDTEALKGFNKFLLLTKDSTKSQQLLGLAMDISRAEGISLSAAMKKATGIYNGSARSVKEYGLKSETAMGRVREARKKERGQAAKWAENHPMEVLTGKLSEGFESIAAVLVPLVNESARWVETNIVPMVIDLRDAIGGGDIAAQIVVLAAGIGLLAVVSYAHPLIALVAAITALGIVTAVAVKDDWIGQLTDNLNENREAMRTGDRDVDAFGQSLVHLGDLLNDTLGPIIRPFFAIVGGTWAVAMGLINLDFQGFVDGIVEIARGFIGLILAPFQIVWNLIRGGFGLLGIDVGAMVSDLAGTIGGIISGAIGAIRDAWNSLDFAIPAFDLKWDGITVPNPAHGTIFDVFGTPNVTVLGAGNFRVWEGTGDLIPDFGGGSGRPQQMGMYSGGLWDVPRDMPAFVHQGESIVPADFARRLRGEGGMGGNTYHVTVNVPPTANLADVGREITRALKAFGQGGGQASMRAAIGVRG